MKIFGWILLSIIGLGILGIGGRLIWVAMLPVHVMDNTIQTGHDIVDKTINADNAIYNYEWFKQTYEDIQALKNKTEIAQKQVEQFKIDAGDRSKWTFEDKTEFSRLQSVSQGLQSQLEDVVATYNARAKMANRSIFKDGLIPNMINLGSNFLK